jgi:hypothetical protein
MKFADFKFFLLGGKFPSYICNLSKILLFRIENLSPLFHNFLLFSYMEFHSLLFFSIVVKKEILEISIRWVEDYF